MSEEDYVHPLSPPPEQDNVIASSKPTTPTPEKMAEVTTPSTSTSVSPGHISATTSVRRNRTPPKTSEGGYVCDFEGCKLRPVFNRLCEWNKHMDRHERPYVCREPGCDTREGFTYSGGLLRHQREVHKKHLAKKEPLYCPYPDCPRAQGEGFTRKENLAEHQRRRHTQVSTSSTYTVATATPATNGAVKPQYLSPQQSRKRKRPISPEDDEQEENKYETQRFDDISNHPYVKQLKAIIEQQRNDLARLHNFIGSIPTNSFYTVGTGLMSPQVQSQSPSMV